MKQIFQVKEPLNIIDSPQEIFKKIKKFDIDFLQENFIVIYLNTKNKIVKSEILFKGGIDACLIEPNTIFRKALINNSNKIIIAHNHPSNNLKPSNEDILIYAKLKKAGEIINIDILDSIIFNKKEFYSLNDEVLKC